MKNVYKQSQLFARQTIVIWILFSLFLLSSCTKEFQNEVSDEIKPKSIKEYVTEFHKDPVYMELLDVWGKSYMDNFIDSVLCGKEKTRQNKLSALTAYMKYRNELFNNNVSSDDSYLKYKCLFYETSVGQTKCIGGEDPVYMPGMSFEAHIPSDHFKEMCYEYANRVYSVAGKHGICCGSNSVYSFQDYLAWALPSVYGRFAECCKKSTNGIRIYLDVSQLAYIANSDAMFCWTDLWLYFDSLAISYNDMCRGSGSGGGGGNGSGNGSGSGGDGSSGGSDSGNPSETEDQRDLRVGKECIAKMKTDLTSGNFQINKVSKKSDGEVLLDVASIGVNTNGIITSCIDFLNQSHVDEVAKNFGKNMGKLGLLTGAFQTYIAFSDGDVSAADIAGAVSLALSAVGKLCVVLPGFQIIGATLQVTGCVVGLVATMMSSYNSQMLIEVTLKNNSKVYVHIS